MPVMKIIQPAELPEWEARVRPWLEDAVQYSQDEYDVPYLMEQLQSGMMQMMAVTEDEEVIAVCVTQVAMTRIMKLVICIMTGKEADTWLPLIRDLEECARIMGCRKIVGIARPGWERKLKPYGYEKTHVEMEKIL